MANSKDDEIWFAVTLLVDAKCSTGDAEAWLNPQDKSKINIVQVRRHLLSAKGDIEKVLCILDKHFEPTE